MTADELASSGRLVKGESGRRERDGEVEDEKTMEMIMVPTSSPLVRQGSLRENFARHALLASDGAIAASTHERRDSKVTPPNIDENKHPASASKRNRLCLRRGKTHHESAARQQQPRSAHR